MPFIGIATARLLGQTVNVNFSASTGWGTQPATLALTAPADAFQAVQGQVTDLVIRQGTTELRWRDVRVESIESAEPANAGLWRVTLLDRRWKWRFGYIDGDYNAIGYDGRLIRPRSPRQLAALLGGVLGEAIDAAALPDEARPRTTWRAHSARDELERLCNDYGCAVAFDGPNDATRIVRVGTGAAFVDPQQYGGRVTRSDGQAIPPWPSQIRVIGGTSLWQTELECFEAVGKDTDGTIKPIDQLSYTPAGGWRKSHPKRFVDIPGTYQSDGGTRAVADLATETVFKWYRLTGQAAGGWSPRKLVGTPYEPQSIDDLGPFLDTLLERDGGTGNRLPAVVVGAFYNYQEEVFENVENAAWPGRIRFNNETKCVELDNAAFRWSYDPDGTHVKPAELRLYIGYAVAKDGVPIRYEKYVDNSGPSHGAGARVEHHDEIVTEVIESTPDAGAFGATDNLADVAKEAAHYLAGVQGEYVVRPTAQIELPLIQRFSPDGVLRQISWHGSADGDPPTTTLAYNAELSSYMPDFRDTPAQRARRAAEQAARERQARVNGQIKLPNGAV